MHKETWCALSHTSKKASRIALMSSESFVFHKEQFYLVWPVRGKGDAILPATGQIRCYNAKGQLVPCAGSGQDGEFRSGVQWPEPRFELKGNIVVDWLTNLCWRSSADLMGRSATWEEGLNAVEYLNRQEDGNYPWRLPNINELESLVDCDAHSPALPYVHPFRDVREGYWSSTTSMFEPDWAWALYLTKGAVGVGQKRGTHFYVWPVREGVMRN